MAWTQTGRLIEAARAQNPDFNPRKIGFHPPDLDDVRRAIRVKREAIAFEESRPQPLREAVEDLRAWIDQNAAKVDLSTFVTPRVGAPAIDDGALTVAAFIGPDAMFQHWRRELERHYAANVPPFSPIPAEERTRRLTALRDELADLLSEERAIVAVMKAVGWPLPDDVQPAVVA